MSVTEAKHTPEPWEVNDGHRIYPTSADEWTTETMIAASTYGNADAARIVACVNALAGYATEDIEAVGACLDWDDESPANNVTELSALREVAEAAKKVDEHNGADPFFAMGDAYTVLMNLRAALAKLEALS